VYYKYTTMTHASCHAVEPGARRLHPTHWRPPRSRANLRSVGPEDPKDVARDIARDPSTLVGELAALKGDATHWLTGPEHAALRHRLEAAHAAAKAALVEERGTCSLTTSGTSKQPVALARAMFHTSPCREKCQVDKQDQAQWRPTRRQLLLAGAAVGLMEAEQRIDRKQPNERLVKTKAGAPILG
jgi:hypothetical protein